MDTLTAKLGRLMTRLPEHLRRSLACDRGMELDGHKSFTADTPHDRLLRRSAQPVAARSNENTHRLLRAKASARTR